MSAQLLDGGIFKMNLRLGISAGIILMVAKFLCGRAWSAESDLIWSTFLGGSDVDYGYDLALDKTGCIWVVGVTSSADFPTTTGAFDTTNDDRDIYVAQLSANGDALLQATFLGGSQQDEGYSLALDQAAGVYLTGWTQSSDFPVTTGAYDISLDGVWDAFVIKLTADTGDLGYATFVGGDDFEVGYRLAVDGSGRAHVIGTTSSPNFATTAGCLDSSYNGDLDTFVIRLTPLGNAVEYATFLGGQMADYGLDIAVDGSGSAYLTGYTYSPDFPTTSGSFQNLLRGLTDVFVARLNSSGSALLYSTFLGGVYRDAGRSIALDDFGCAYVTGYTYSTDFPITAEAFDTTLLYSDVDAFVSKITASGHSLALSTYLGGEDTDSGYGIALDGSGNICVTGFTASADFPTTSGAFDRSHNGQRDVFVSLLNADGSALNYSTFLGGGEEDYGWDLVLEGPATSYINNIFMTGDTQSEGFPTTGGGFDADHNGSKDAFVLKLCLDDLVSVESISPPAPWPDDFLLVSNYPNPFNASTAIRYQIPFAGTVTLKVFNTLGQQVCTLVDESQEAGWHTVLWDGRNDLEQRLASGAYFCCLRAEGFYDTVKMLLVR